MGGLHHDALRNLVLALVTSAPLLGCGSDAADPDEPGAPRDVEARVDIIAPDADVAYPLNPLTPTLLADESGVYWQNSRGAVLARHPGEDTSIVLRQAIVAEPGEGITPHALSMAMDDEQLYVGEAWLPRGVVDYFPVPVFEPPGRLLSIPKRGGTPTVLLELEDRVVWPLVAEPDMVIVFIEGSEQSAYYLLRPSTLELERLPLRAPFGSSVRAGDTFYWSDGDYPPSLLRTRLEGGEPEVVTELENNSFWAGPGYVLSLRERLVEPDYTVSQSFVIHEENADAERTLPGLDETISLDAALDARHAYWFSYPGAGPGQLPVENPLLRLARVDIRSGALTLLNTPDLPILPGTFILGQDAGHVYLRNDVRLVAVEKPD
jgi:hypothetical protein